MHCATANTTTTATAAAITTTHYPIATISTHHTYHTCSFAATIVHATRLLLLYSKEQYNHYCLCLYYTAATGAGNTDA
jgi:hypothetical protein